jgi:hemerythrin-like domain-containing protein
VDILDIIKQEHREVAEMLDQAVACEPGDRRMIELAATIAQALDMHVKIEERLFYSTLTERADDDEERVDMYEAYTEHDVAEHLLGMIASNRKPDEKFKAELQVLSESVKHHVKEEESTAFKLAHKVLDDQERDALGDKWMKAKQRAMSAGTGSRKKAGAKKSSSRKTSTSRKKAATPRAGTAAASNGRKKTAKKTQGRKKTSSRR